jgi:xanthine/uracil permease
MSKLDEVKEILNTLRVAMSLSFGMLVIVVSGVIKRFDDNNVDSIFWLGILFTVFLLTVIFLLIIKISQRTKEIKEL